MFALMVRNRIFQSTSSQAKTHKSDHNPKNPELPIKTQFQKTKQYYKTTREKETNT